MMTLLTNSFLMKVLRTRSLAQVKSSSNLLNLISSTLLMVMKVAMVERRNFMMNFLTAKEYHSKEILTILKR